MLNFNQSLLITSSVIGIKKPEINNRSKPVYDIFLLLLTLLIKPKSSSSIKITLLKNISKIGIMAGASTPSESINNTVEKLKEIC